MKTCGICFRSADDFVRRSGLRLCFLRLFSGRSVVYRILPYLQICTGWRLCRASCIPGLIVQGRFVQYQIVAFLHAASIPSIQNYIDKIYCCCFFSSWRYRHKLQLTTIWCRGQAISCHRESMPMELSYDLRVVCHYRPLYENRMTGYMIVCQRQEECRTN